MIHVIIAEERRVSTEEKARQLAIPINNDLVTKRMILGIEQTEITPRPAQLHSMGERLDNPADPNILYAAEWDQKSPWITVRKGAIADLKMAFLGWPMVENDGNE